MTARRLSLFAAGLLLSASTGAMTVQAADVEVPATDLWSGFYLGAQAGYMQGTGGDTDLCFGISGLGTECFSDADDGFDISDNNMDGVTVGGYVGYNYRIDSVVIGIEGDANWDNANGSNSILGELNYDTGINWDISLRARLGFVVDERALLYVTGGPSWVSTELDSNLNFISADVANVSSGDDSTEFGWVLGAGAEYAITEHLSVKAEYLHGWYGDADLDIFKAPDGLETAKYVLKQNLQTNVVRVGLAYHFGGF
jgi:outer membrane immunogenic protein